MYKLTDVFNLYDNECNDEVICWIEQNSSIMLRAIVKGYNDPVELTSDEAREIAKKLIEMADKLDAELLKN